jgi:hypothetical protein
VIRDKDSIEEKNAKLRMMEANFLRLEQIKADRAEEVVYLLDLFDGKVTVNELLNMDIPYLNQLKNAKIKINSDLAKRK